MSPRDVRAALAEIIGDVAPEADLDDLEDDTDLRDELDIDSMDFLKLVVEVKKRFGVEIPESDYRKVDSFGAMATYVVERCSQ